METAGIERHALCVRVDHLIKDYDFYVKKMAQTSVRNHAHRGNHQHYARMTLTNPQKHVGNLQHALKEKRVIDSGCSRHMTKNMSYLSNFEEIAGGYVAFGRNPKGGRSLGKAEAVNTACYVQNRVLVTKPQNKTPYELIHGKTPSICFMRTFGCLVTILNTLDTLGKFDGKVNEGFLLGYSVSSKAFRNTDRDAAFEVKEPEFERRKPQSEVYVSPSSSAQTRKHDDKTKTEAKGKSHVESLTGYRNLSAKFEDFSDNCINEVNVDDSLVPAVGQILTNNTNTFSAAGSLNLAVLSMHDDELEPAELQEVVEVVTTAKLMTEIVTAASATITAADALITAATLTVAPSAARRRKGVVIRDPEETATPSIITHSEPKSKDKGKGILVEEPKPLKKQAQIEQDEAYTRELEAELNKNINWDDVINQVQRKEKEDNAVMRYQALKKNPQTEAQARKNMMIYPRNMAGFKMDYFKGMKYDDIRHTKEEGIDYEEFFAPVARIESIRLFLAYASFMGFMVYQMDVKSAFLYGTIEEEVYVCQPLGFEDLDYPDKVYKVVKALYGLHQAPKACQDKYVAKILRKFGLTDRKSASTTIDTEKPLLKDPDGEDVDVHTYRSMIGSLMYLTSSRLDIMFATSVLMKPMNDVLRLQALVDKKKVIITEATIRDALRLDDAEGINCLPSEEIFTELARMGYEKPSTKLTFYRAFFLNTPLFEGMLVAQQVDKSTAKLNVDDVPAAGVADEGVAEVNVDVVPAAVDEPSIPSPTSSTQPPPPSQDIPSTSQDKIVQALEIIMLKERVKNLEIRNKVKVFKLKRLKKDIAKDVAVDAEIEESVDVQGRQADTTITAAAPQLTIAVAPTLTTAPSAARRRKEVVIRDPKETPTPSTIIHSEAKSKDKGEGILVEEPKPLKKQAQIK
nr:retrovirus-related Pol polyprotein from transposon TNT 1-94 [Tanacetum cinerariifolium]